jgi:amidophosphoribosyltransferase
MWEDCMSEIREECGVLGIYAPRRTRLAELVYYGLFALQHREQESAGIVVNDDGVFTAHKDAGLVGEIFLPSVLEVLGEGNIAVGHTRYGTTGAGQKENAQPLLINHRKGRMALAHNGNLTNSY